jgi:hypothetical protein
LRQQIPVVQLVFSNRLAFLAHAPIRPQGAKSTSYNYVTTQLQSDDRLPKTEIFSINGLLLAKAFTLPITTGVDRLFFEISVLPAGGNGD